MSIRRIEWRRRNSLFKLHWKSVKRKSKTFLTSEYLLANRLATILFIIDKFLSFGLPFVKLYHVAKGNSFSFRHTWYYSKSRKPRLVHTAYCRWVISKICKVMVGESRWIYVASSPVTRLSTFPSSIKGRFRIRNKNLQNLSNRRTKKVTISCQVIISLTWRNKGNVRNAKLEILSLRLYEWSELRYGIVPWQK